MIQDSIPQKPADPHDPLAAKRLLSCARSYLENAGRLIYSYGSKTFLSGYALFDTENGSRGNIDCSTFVMLVLSGIPYEDSPYVLGAESIRDIRPAAWAEQDLIDFYGLPERYVEIADLIGRPYLKGPKGIDLKKAEELGIGMDVLAGELKAAGVMRRTLMLSEHYLSKGSCFTDRAQAMPGDLVFFLSKEFFTEGEQRYAVRPMISHVGIIAEDTAMMIHSSGTWRRGADADAAGDSLPAVALSPVNGSREPAFFARPGLC